MNEPDPKQYRPVPSADDFLMGGPAELDPEDAGKGPWTEARYDGECATGGVAVFEGDMIRADGDGGWEGQD